MSFSVEVSSSLDEEKEDFANYLSRQEESAQSSIDRGEKEKDLFDRIDDVPKDLFGQLTDIIEIYEKEIKNINGDLVTSGERVDEQAIEDGAKSEGFMFPSSWTNNYPKRTPGFDGGSGSTDENEITLKNDERTLFDNWESGGLSVSQFKSEWEPLLRSQYDPDNETGVLIRQEEAVSNNEDVGGTSSAAYNNIQTEKDTVEGHINDLSTISTSSGVDSKISTRRDEIDDRINNELNPRLSTLDDNLSTDPGYYDDRYSVVTARVHRIFGTLRTVFEAKRSIDWWKDVRDKVQEIQNILS